MDGDPEKDIWRDMMARKSTAMMLSIMLAALFLFVALAPVAADPVQDRKDELDRIKGEVQRIDARLESVAEQYNMTNLRVQETRKGIAQKEEELSALSAMLQQRREILGDRLRELYENGNADVLEVLTESRTVDDLYTNVDRAQRISGKDVDIITSVIGAREQADVAREELEARKAELDQTVAELAGQKSRIEADLQKRRELMAGVEADINRLIAQEEANRAAANN